MNRLALQVTCVVALSVTLFWSIWPLDKTLRLGKDLRGGVSLVYAVKMPPTAKPEQVLKQVIDVLKQRVNPTGVLDISFVPQGRDRIEVVMPLPGAEVRAKQVAFKQALTELASRSVIDATELNQTLAAGGAVQRFGGTDPAFKEKIAKLQAAYDQAKSARSALEAATKGGGDISAAETALAKAENELEAQLSGVATKGMGESRLLRVLALDHTPRPMRDAQGAIMLDENGKTRMGPSERDRGLQAIRAEFAGSAKDLDAMLAAYAEYEKVHTSLDDPEDLKRLFRGAGVLDFRIALKNSIPEGVNPEQMRKELAERGPSGAQSAVAAWYPINDPKQWGETPAQIDALLRDPATYFAQRDLIAASYDGKPYILLSTLPENILTHSSGGHSWSMERASRSVDELGRTSVAFQLDKTGGEEMGRLTGPHVGRAMAVILDGQVYTAPNLQSRITSHGQITGSFDEEEVKYLIRVLSAGALEGQLSAEPVSVSVLGPSLGSDNLQRGLLAVALSTLVLAVVKILYYLVAGGIADISLIVNALVIFGVMSFMDATFTLPGLAGVALSMAIAVDANVLIYERIREELVINKEPLRNAVRLGFQRAFAAIFDGNIANLIICTMLIMFAGTEVKGFGVTMAIGVFATFITGLWVTRVLLAVWTNWMGQKKLPMLAIVFPGVARALLPSIDWIKIRGVLVGGAFVVAVVCLFGIVHRGSDIFETEFRGGVSITMTTRLAKPGEAADKSGHLLLSRAEVEHRIQEVGKKNADNAILSEFAAATALTVGEQTADFRAATFQLKIPNPSSIEDESKITSTVTNAVVKEFASEMDARLPSKFVGSDDASHAKNTFPLERDTIGASVGRPGLERPVGNFRGGVAVVIDGIEPPVTVEDLKQRMTRLRNQPDFSEQAGRDSEVIGLDPVTLPDGKSGFRSLVVLVSDPSINSLKSPFETWDATLAATEWKLISTAVGQGTTLDQVSSFSPSVARNLVANATVAVAISLLLMLGYIWVRFGSFRFSFCTVLSLVLNMVVCLGALAFSGMISRTSWGAALGISDFRIDLNVVAGLLTVLGYGLNDAVVILDRIRENRGKAHYATRTVVNSSINQSFGRTVLTGGNSLATALILYELGGAGLKPFGYVYFVGVLVSTFSSVAIAATLVYVKNEDPTAQAKAESDLRTGSKALPA
ncbi:MAG: protein translocase subunit SecD [Planctomycetes bacterium]|nr:protein translocase subunit SecD [Planctomycetota bacterium]